MSTDDEKREKIHLNIDRHGSIQVHKTETLAKNKLPLMDFQYLFLFGGIGTSIVIPMVVGALVGRYIDIQWESRPTATVLGIGMGFILSLINVVTTVQTFLRTKK